MISQFRIIMDPLIYSNLQPSFQFSAKTRNVSQPLDSFSIFIAPNTTPHPIFPPFLIKLHQLVFVASHYSNTTYKLLRQLHRIVPLIAFVSCYIYILRRDYIHIEASLGAVKHHPRRDIQKKKRDPPSTIKYKRRVLIIELLYKAYSYSPEGAILSCYHHVLFRDSIEQDRAVGSCLALGKFRAQVVQKPYSTSQCQG